LKARPLPTTLIPAMPAWNHSPVDGGPAVPLFPDLIGFGPLPADRRLDLDQIFDVPGHPRAQRAKRSPLWSYIPRGGRIPWRRRPARPRRRLDRDEVVSGLLCADPLSYLSVDARVDGGGRQVLPGRPPTSCCGCSLTPQARFFQNSLSSLSGSFTIRQWASIHIVARVLGV
jgi:hypothetical protein